MLGQHAMRNRMMNKPPSQVAFTNARTRPVDYLRRQHAANSQFFAEPKQQDINRRRIGVGQFGKIADSHHQRHIRTVNIRVHQTDLRAVERERNREIYRDG